MIQRRPSRLSPAVPPLTPSFPTPTTPSNPADLAQIESLKDDVNRLQKILRSERMNAARNTAALGKYNSILEATVAAQRRAFIELHAELIPSASTLTKGRQ